jgi:enoyl-CoA hydratase/carnithine racemase
VTRSFIAALVEEHRAIEAGLDRLADAVAAGEIDAAIFRKVSDLTSRHYLREDEFLTALRAHEPGLAAKLKAQHEEALEIAAALEESLGGAPADAVYLVRRFLAIARHNVIEEERDVFPLAERCFGAEEGAP